MKKNCKKNLWNRFLGHFRPLFGVHPIGPIWEKPSWPRQQQIDDLGKRPSGARVASKSGSEGPFGCKLLFPKGTSHFYKVLIWFFFRSVWGIFLRPRKALKTGDFTPRKPEFITNIGNRHENSKNAKSPHLVQMGKLRHHRFRHSRPVFGLRSWFQFSQQAGKGLK